MDDAWVGPLYWIQWAGGRRRLHPRGRRTGPGGEVASPGLRTCCAACGACTERVLRLLRLRRFGRKSTPVFGGDQSSHHGS